MNENTLDLDRAIADWRDELRAAGITNPTLLKELESHLRDDLDRQTKAGVALPQAFANAVRQIGPAAALDAEFRKIGENKLKREQRWLRIYCRSFSILYSVIGTFAVFKVEMSPAERILGLMAVGAGFSLILGTPHYHTFLPVIDNGQRRQRIQIALTLAWIVVVGSIANLVLPHLNLTTGQVVVVFLWLMNPAAAFGGIGYGLDDAVRRQSARLV